jgi:hypothetical protein
MSPQWLLERLFQHQKIIYITDYNSNNNASGPKHEQLLELNDGGFSFADVILFFILSRWFLSHCQQNEENFDFVSSNLPFTISYLLRIQADLASLLIEPESPGSIVSIVNSTLFDRFRETFAAVVLPLPSSAPSASDGGAGNLSRRGRKAVRKNLRKKNGEAQPIPTICTATGITISSSLDEISCGLCFDDTALTRFFDCLVGKIDWEMKTCGSLKENLPSANLSRLA